MEYDINAIEGHNELGEFKRLSFVKFKCLVGKFISIRVYVTNENKYKAIHSASSLLIFMIHSENCQNTPRQKIICITHHPKLFWQIQSRIIDQDKKLYEKVVFVKF